MTDDVLRKEFQLLPLTKLRESKTNPRRHFDSDSLKELRDSIMAQGLLTPLLVRAGRGGTFEIVCGARRFRAAKLAKLTTLPARVRKLTDLEVLEIQIVENLQREDVHPLDEAAGYQALLLQDKDCDVAALAAKVGRSESYVYQRLKLNELTPEGKKTFLKGEISAGHAILIARLQPADQKASLQMSARQEFSVRSLAHWIQRQFMLDLASAAFPKDDAKLGGGVGSCLECPKRTGYSPALFPEIEKKDTCTDRDCFRKKQEAFISRLLTQHEGAGEKVELVCTSYVAYGERLPKGTHDHKSFLEIGDYTQGGKQYGGVKIEECENAVPAIECMQSDTPGRQLRVCVTPKCEVHRARAATRVQDPWRAKQKERQQQLTLTESRTRDEVLAKVRGGPLAGRQLLLVCHSMIERMWYENLKALAQRLGRGPGRVGIKGTANWNYAQDMLKYAEGMKGPALSRLAVELALAQLGESDLAKAAARFGVDRGKIAKQVAAELKAAKEQKRQKKAQKKAG